MKRSSVELLCFDAILYVWLQEINGDGEMPKGKLWRMKEKCADCPFSKTGPGLHLRRTLRPGRWREILASLRRGEHFCCHKTTNETGDGSNLICAGTIEWQEKHGCVAQFVQICERIDYWIRQGKIKTGGNQSSPPQSK